MKDDKMRTMPVNKLMLNMGIPVILRIISVSFVFAGANVAFQGFFQALNGGIESLIISVCRQIVFIFPFVWIFAAIAEKDPTLQWTLWLTFPIGEGISVLIGCMLMKKIYTSATEKLEKAAIQKFHVSTEPTA